MWPSRLLKVIGISIGAIQEATRDFCCNQYKTAFSALTLLVGWQEGHPACKKLSGGVLAWLSVWSELQTCIWPNWCHCHSLSLASVKSRLVLPFWYQLTRVVPEQRAIKWVCVCHYKTIYSIISFSLLYTPNTKWQTSKFYPPIQRAEAVPWLEIKHTISRS